MHNSRYLNRPLAGTFLPLVTVLAAAGCAKAPTPAIFADDAGTAAQALASGKTLKAYDANMSSGLAGTWDSNNSRWKDNEAPGHRTSEFSIKRNGQGGVDVTIDGETVSYASADQDGDFGWKQTDGDGNYRELYSWTDTADKVLSGTSNVASYHQLWRYFWDKPQGGGLSDEQFGFAVVGAETRPEALAGKANATYSGYGHMEFYPADVADAGYNRAAQRGDLTMQADFAAGQISGNLGNLQTRANVGGTWTGWTAANGSISLDTAPIVGNGFSGTLTASNDLVIDPGVGASTDSTYAGKFYGPSGEEVGGVFSITTEKATGTGAFSAKQD